MSAVLHRGKQRNSTGFATVIGPIGVSLIGNGNC